MNHSVELSCPGTSRLLFDINQCKSQQIQAFWVYLMYLGYSHPLDARRLHFPNWVLLFETIFCRYPSHRLQAGDEHPSNKVLEGGVYINNLLRTYITYAVSNAEFRP